MTTTSLATVAITLALVFGLLAVTLRLLRRITIGTGLGGRASLEMAVVQRLALGPRQGIAVVRIGDRLLAVSLGEGGVRPLLELDTESEDDAVVRRTSDLPPVPEHAGEGRVPARVPAFARSALARSAAQSMDATPAAAGRDTGSRGGAPARRAARLWATSLQAVGPLAARLRVPHAGRAAAAAAALGALFVDLGAGIAHAVRAALRSLGVTLALVLALGLASSALAQGPRGTAPADSSVGKHPLAALTRPPAGDPRPLVGAGPTRHGPCSTCHHK